MNTKVLSKKTRGVLLIGHGTQDDTGTAQFFTLADKLATRLSPNPVEPALLEFQKPTIPEAWESLVSKGAEHIHIAPLLLFAAGHAKGDIPKIIADCQAKTPSVSIDQARPISRHRSIIDLVVKRLQGTLEQFSSSPRRTAVVMVGRGSDDPCAQADMRVLSEIVAHRIDAGATRTAFYAMARPPLPQVLRQVAASGRFDSVAVYPHLLFEGRLYQAIIQQTKDASREHAGMQWATTAYLGPDAGVADAMAERIEIP